MQNSEKLAPLLGSVLNKNYAILLFQIKKKRLSKHSIGLTKVMIYLLNSCNTEERIAQNIYIHNSNKNYKKFNYNNNINQETDRHRL